MTQDSEIKRTPWTPILDGSIAAQARQVVRLIASDLDRLAEESDTGLTSPVGSHASHLAELGLLHGYLAATERETYHRWKALDYLSKASTTLASEHTSAALHGGFIGVAWITEHLHTRIFRQETHDLNVEIDDALATLLSDPRSHGYDLVNGMVGWGIYLLDRLPNARAHVLLERILDRLADMAEQQLEGVTWFRTPERLPPWERASEPEGYYSLGMAHGVPGVIALLAHIYWAFAPSYCGGYCGRSFLYSGQSTML